MESKNSKPKSRHMIICFDILDSGRIDVGGNEKIYKTWEGATANQYGIKTFRKLSENCRIGKREDWIDFENSIATVLVDIRNLVAQELEGIPELNDLITLVKVMQS